MKIQRALAVVAIVAFLASSSFALPCALCTSHANHQASSRMQMQHEHCGQTDGQPQQRISGAHCHPDGASCMRSSSAEVVGVAGSSPVELPALLPAESAAAVVACSSPPITAVTDGGPAPNVPTTPLRI